jgi:DNA-directed RNA polymerase specialized sigma subunit
LTKYRKRNETIKTENLKARLDTLESTGHLDGHLHPRHIEPRLQKYYKIYNDGGPGDPLTNIMNLLKPLIYSIIKQNFTKKYFDGGVYEMDDFYQEAMISIIQAIKKQNYNADKNTQLYSFLYMVGFRGILSYINKQKILQTKNVKISI